MAKQGLQHPWTDPEINAGEKQDNTEAERSAARNHCRHLVTVAVTSSPTHY